MRIYPKKFETCTNVNTEGFMKNKNYENFLCCKIVTNVRRVLGNEFFFNFHKKIIKK